MTSQDLPNPAEYEQASLKFRGLWVKYIDLEEKAKFEIVYMLKILESNGWNKTRAIEKILDAHNDLKEFSR